MKIFTFRSIKTRLIFWFLVLTLVPLFLVLLVTYYQRIDVINYQRIDKLSAIRDLKVQQLEFWLNERKSDMEVFATDSEITKIGLIINSKKSNSNNDNKLLDIHNTLEKYVQNYSAYSQIFIINPHTGIIIASSDENMIGRNKSTDDYFTIPMRTKKISIKDIYYSKSILDYTMAYSTPIVDPDNNQKITGILVARIDLANSLYRVLLDRVGLGNTGETLIVNDKTVALNALRWYDNAPLNLKINAQPARNAANGETGVLITDDYRGVEVLAAYTYIDDTRWGFVCKQDTSELYSTIVDMTQGFIFIFLFVSILITIIAFSISNNISKKIIAINNVAKKMTRGDFSVRNEISSQDELGSLANGFNNMADLTESRISIQQGISSLSETMIGRTSIEDFSMSLIKKLKELSGANIFAFFILNESEKTFDHLNSIGADLELFKNFNSVNPEGDFGNAISTKSIYFLNNIPHETHYKYKTVIGYLIPKEILIIPILVENTVVAIISIATINKFSIDFHDIINNSWDIINTSYSNLISSERTRVFADHLGRINEQIESKSQELEEQTAEMKKQAVELHNTSRELQIQNIELEKQKIQVIEANKLKSEFLSNMSHELRTPLNSIMALSSVLISDSVNKLNDDEINYLTIIERNGKNLLKLINDILDLSKIEAGKMEIVTESISISMLLNLVIENLHAIAKNKGLKINIEIPDNLPYVETDESRLHQVLINIIGNAIKFTEKGSVSIIVQLVNDIVTLNVVDTGIGIPKDVLPHIFDEFRQADGTSSRQFEGTGLGLAIAKKLIQILGGDISVNSELGRGTNFTISIPITIQQYPLLDDVEKTSLIIDEIENNNKTVLIIDDDPVIVENISIQLSEFGYKTIGTNSSKEALFLAKKHKPIAITLDIIMPDMDGWEVLQKLKEDSDTSNIPVIIISVSNEKDTGLALGAFSFVNKPINKDDLIGEINRINEHPSTVMIVDDNEAELNEMAKIIENNNITTIKAKSGNECFRLMNKIKPTILVLDLLMPDIDGFTVLYELRKKNATKDLPVIIVTAKDLSIQDKAKLEKNVNSVILKSENTPKDLFGEIKRILSNIDINKDSISNNSNTAYLTTEEHTSSNDGIPQIVIVEDNPDNMTTIRAILKNKYNLHEAFDGEQAIKIIEDKIPNLILLDLSLPKISGAQVIKILKANTLTNHIPIIIVTAQAMIGDKESILKLGCDDYVSKPIDKTDLLRKIQNQLTKHRITD